MFFKFVNELIYTTHKLFHTSLATNPCHPSHLKINCLGVVDYIFYSGQLVAGVYWLKTNLDFAIFVTMKLMGQFSCIENKKLFWFHKKANSGGITDAILNATIKCDFTMRKSILKPNGNHKPLLNDICFNQAFPGVYRSYDPGVSYFIRKFIDWKCTVLTEIDDTENTIIKSRYKRTYLHSLSY